MTANILSETSPNIDYAALPKTHEYQQEGMKSLKEGVRPMLFSEYISAHKSAQGKLEAVLNRML